MKDNLVFIVRDIHNEDIRILLSSIVSYRQVGEYVDLQTASGRVQFFGNIQYFDDFLRNYVYVREYRVYQD